MLPALKALARLVIGNDPTAVAELKTTCGHEGVRRSPGQPNRRSRRHAPCLVVLLRLPCRCGFTFQPLRGLHPVPALLREWLLELKVMVAASGPSTGAPLRMRPPKVLKEMSAYTPEKVALIFDSAKIGWPQLAVKILLGTGIRVGELVNLLLEDVEDDEDAIFLKIKPGKGAKFRRVPVTQRLRRRSSATSTGAAQTATPPTCCCCRLAARC